MKIARWLYDRIWVCDLCGYTTRDSVKYLAHKCAGK